MWEAAQIMSKEQLKGRRNNMLAKAVDVHRLETKLEAAMSWSQRPWRRWDCWEDRGTGDWWKKERLGDRMRAGRRTPGSKIGERQQEELA